MPYPVQFVEVYSGSWYSGAIIALLACLITLLGLILFFLLTTRERSEPHMIAHDDDLNSVEVRHGNAIYIQTRRLLRWLSTKLTRRPREYLPLHRMEPWISLSEARYLQQRHYTAFRGSRYRTASQHPGMILRHLEDNPSVEDLGTVPVDDAQRGGRLSYI
jgi:hypothetical protein